ncbi:hypothetical protein WKT02_07840 [Erysipelotrichaceae bacterium HCN-30851]
MRYEILYILKTKISKICFFLLLIMNLWGMLSLSGNDNKLQSVETNITSFEYEMQEAQSLLSQLNLSYRAQEAWMDEQQKEDWKNYETYLEWKIENAKKGWNLFNNYGQDVFDDAKLWKKYKQIVIWDLAYQMDCYANPHYHQNVSEIVFQDTFEEGDFSIPNVSFQSSRLYSIQSIISEDAKGYYDHYKNLLEDNLYRETSDEKQIVGGEGPWGFLLTQLRQNSIFALAISPLCVFYTIMMLNSLQKDGGLRLVEVQPMSKIKLFLHQILCVEACFLTLLATSLLIPIVLLGIQHGFGGLHTRVLMYEDGLTGFQMMDHGTYYINNLVSEYYGTVEGLMPAGLTYQWISTALMFTMILGIVKITFYIVLGVMIFFFVHKAWEKYIFGGFCIIIYGVSQYHYSGLFSFLNPFDVRAGLSVVSGTGNQTWLYSLCLLLIWIFLLLMMSRWIAKKDFE